MNQKNKLNVLTSEGIEKMLSNVPANSFKVWESEQICCTQSLFYFICSENDGGNKTSYFAVSKIHFISITESVFLSVSKVKAT